MSEYHPEDLKIVSGGQTGVDRVALDFAIEHGIKHGGWCPRGRIAQDGIISSCYHLRETRSASYPERTHRNILDSDATLIFAEKYPLTRGTRLTADLAKKEGRPLLTLTQDLPVEEATERSLGWLREQRVATLNIAGPREDDRNARLMAFTREVLSSIFTKATSCSSRAD